MRISRRTFLSWAAGPVFQTGVPAATKDKPQSKIWYAHGFWWALLGNGVWKRSPSGWRRERHLDGFLSGLPGQADVLTDGDHVAAVLVEENRLAVVRLAWDGRYRPEGDPAILTGHRGIETATIASAAGRLWIAYNSQRDMWARSAAPGGPWSPPVRINTTAAKDDDICQIAAFAGSVSVIWSDQASDAVYLRHFAGGQWLPAETADSGGKTADDHISTAVAQDGTLYVATKNSVDAEGQPQLVLRIRDPKGRWRNIPYAPLTAALAPTRPIALIGSDHRTLHLLHTVAHRGTKPARSGIVIQDAPDSEARTLIEGPAQINNVTGPKAHFPAGGGLVLASDAFGNIYEALIGRRGSIMANAAPDAISMPASGISARS